MIPTLAPRLPRVRIPPGTCRQTFHAVPLVSALMELLCRKRRHAVPTPDPDWEQHEPMSGLS